LRARSGRHLRDQLCDSLRAGQAHDGAGMVNFPDLLHGNGALDLLADGLDGLGGVGRGSARSGAPLSGEQLSRHPQLLPRPLLSQDAGRVFVEHVAVQPPDPVRVKIMLKAIDQGQVEGAEQR
jgi:hypothetical protein